MNLSRRHFLSSAFLMGGGLSVPFLFRSNYPELKLAAPIIDIHVHLFGILEKNGCWISSNQRTHWTHPYLLQMLGIKDADDIDDAYVEKLAEMVRHSSLDKVVLQAWDGRVDSKGLVSREQTTSLLVPNDYLFKVVERHPQLFIPCASINPYRVDAVEELHRCADLGAPMVKVHPPTMDADPSKRCLTMFYQACADRGVIVMVHTGHEHAAHTVGIHNADPNKLELALDLGCTVISAHAGTGQFHDPTDFFENFLDLIPKYPNLYCDNSIMAAFLRWRNIPSILEDAGATERMIHGSDFPFPSNALVFWNRVSPRMTARLMTEQNFLERDLQLKRALGVPETAFTLGARLLGPFLNRDVNNETSV